MNYFSRLLREPLLHFFVIGALLFVAFSALNQDEAPSADVIIVTPDRIDQLANNFEAVWRRQPSAKELDALVDGDVREEILYREALSLGLDSGDTIIRRRLRQKMEFLTDAGSELLEPQEGELETFLTENADTYRQPPRIGFEQIYLGENPTETDAAALLAEVQANPPSDPAALGERTLLPAQIPLSFGRAIDGVFGTGFFAGLESQPVEDWSGPVLSSYGVHLVHITEREDGRMPPLDEIREAVLRDWKKNKADELADAFYARLKEGYTVDIQREGSLLETSR